MDNVTINAACNHLGYGQVGKNICKALSKLCNVSLFPIGNQIDVEPEEVEFFNQLINNGQSQAKLNDPCVKIWHQHDLWNHISNPYLAWTIFELDKFSELELANLKFPDKLIVCSNWAKWVIHSNIPDMPYDKVHVVPLGVDRNIFCMPTTKSPETDIYKFFTIGKLEYRKGHDFIVDCFNKAFNGSSKVELNMMVHNVFLKQDVINHWLGGFKNTKLGNKINFINPVKSHQDVADFINSQDCGLFPAKAEGWNLELLESMACGKPVIATNYSAHTEYCNSSNTFLIETPNKELAHDHMGGMWFHGQGSWAELEYEQEEQMIEHMKKCYETRPVNLPGVETSKEFTWDNSAKKLLEVV